MLARLAALSVVVLAGVAALIAPTRPFEPRPAPAPPAESAIALLGEAWDLAPPEPLVVVAPPAGADLRPLPRPVAESVDAELP
ncbi:MAG: hypothetical protein ACOCY0_02145, partial [Roseicyclus sp.]